MSQTVTGALPFPKMLKEGVKAVQKHRLKLGELEWANFYFFFWSKNEVLNIKVIIHLFREVKAYGY